MLPDADTSRIEDIINDSDYYRCDDFKIIDVLNQSFVSGFLKSGVFYSKSLPSASSELSDEYSLFNNKLLLRLHKQSMNSVNAIELGKLHPRADGEFLSKSIQQSTM